MSSRIVVVLLLVQGALVPAVAAQDAPPPSARTFIDPANGLSLEQAIARALAREPSIQAERRSIDAARGVRDQAGLRRNPSVSVEQREEPAGSDSQTMVTVEWPLDLFRRTGRTAVADREIAVAESAVANRERVLAADVRMRYGEALAGVRGLSVLQDLVAAVRKQHELLRARVEQGSSPPLERDVVTVELQRLEADERLQLGRLEGAFVELKRILGTAPAERLELREALEDVVLREASMSAKSVAGETAGRRQDVIEAEARIGLADAKADRARRDGRFDVSIIGGYTRMDAGFPQFGVSASGIPERVRGQFHYISVGAMLDLPLFNRNQGELAVAQAERAAAGAYLEAARLSVAAEVASARARDVRAQEAVRLYSAGSRTLARQNLTVVEQSYELGRTTVFEVLAEQKRYLELERAYTDALRAAYEARAALKFALGEMQ